MKTLTIKSEKQLSALTSAIRQEIVDVLAEAEVLSVAEIAGILRKPADALYYHLRILEKASLIVCAGSEREGGRCAMLYRTKAPRLRVDVESARQNGGKSLGAVVGSMLRLGTRDYRRALLLERLVTLGPQRQLVAKRKTGWLLPDQLRAVNGIIEDLDRQISGAREGGELYAITVLLTPLRPQRRRHPKTPGRKTSK